MWDKRGIEQNPKSQTRNRKKSQFPNSPIDAQEPAAFRKTRVSKCPNQQGEGENAAAEGDGAPETQARQAPPHDQTGNDPDNDAEAGDVHEQAPKFVPKIGLQVSATEVHSDDGLRDSHALALDPELLVFD